MPDDEQTDALILHLIDRRNAAEARAERLTKAGDDLAKALLGNFPTMDGLRAVTAWNATVGKRGT